MNECIQCRTMVADWERIGGLCNACNDIKKSREIRGDNVCINCGTLTATFEQVCIRCQHKNMKAKKHTKRDLEDKISELEDKLTTLSDQLGSKPKQDDIFSLNGHDSVESYFNQYDDNSYAPESIAKLEVYEKDYLSRIEHEPKTMPKGIEYTKPLPPTRQGGTLPKGFGRTGKTYSISELDGKSKQLSVKTRLLMSAVITGAIAVVLGSSLGDIGMIIAVGSSPIPFTLIAIGLKKIKLNNKNEHITRDAVKASLLQSMLITLGVAKVKSQPSDTENLPSSSSRGTLPKGF